MATVLITGGGRRLGKGMALEFAKKQWDVIIIYNKSRESAGIVVEEIKKYNVKSIAIKADVRIKKEIENAFEEIEKKFTLPDVLVNNAGIFPEKKSLDDISVEFWDNTLNVNLRGEFLTSQVFAKYARPGSRIINIASLGGLEIWKQRIPYNVSKAGVIQLTKALARELAPRITANAICPGAIYVEDDPSINDTTLIELKKIPMERWGKTKDIFDAALFFATCSDYITGQVLTVDGGYHDAR